MANIDQYFPWLKNLMHKFEMLKSTSISQEVVGGELGVAIHLRDVLMESRSQRCELAISIGDGFDYELLWLSQLRILSELGHGVKQEEDSVDRILGELLWLSVGMEVNQLLPE